MKKSLVIGILGLAASIASTFGQGAIQLCNYFYEFPPKDVVYGAGSGGTVGAPVTTNAAAGGTYTAGLYFVAGNVVSSFAADPTGTALPSSLYSGPGTLTLGAGPGSTGIIGIIDEPPLEPFIEPGEYCPVDSFNPGLGGAVEITVMIIAYNGSSYTSATVRGHSAPFTMITSSGTANPQITQAQETDGGFAVFTVPEPSVLALSSLGAAALMLVRRRK